MQFTIGLRAIVVVLVAVVVTITGVAYAMIPGADGVIHGCFKRSGGTLRVIDPSVEVCGSNESPLSWSQVGPQGETGATGETGAPGISGYEIVSRSEDHGPGTFAGGFVRCPTGKVPLGGGAGVSDPEDDDGSFFGAASVEMDFPLSDLGGVGWKASFAPNPSLLVPSAYRATVYAVCAFVDN